VRVLRGAAILVRDGCVAELGNSDAMRARHAAAPSPAQHPHRRERVGSEGNAGSEGSEKNEAPGQEAGARAGLQEEGGRRS